MAKDTGLDWSDYEKTVRRMSLAIHDEQKMTQLHRRAGKKIERRLHSRIVPMSKDKSPITGKGEVRGYTYKGQIGRSLKTWKMKGSDNTVTVGARIGRTVGERDDGWFAHIVEAGKARYGKAGGSYSSINKGAFARTFDDSRNGVISEVIRGYERMMKKASR